MKKHFKLYKSGKNWLIAGIVTLAAGLAFSVTSANADTLTDGSNSQVNNDVQQTQVINSSSDIINDSEKPTSTAISNQLKASEESQTSADSTNNQSSVIATTTVNYAANANVKNGWVKQSDGTTAYYRNGQLDSGREYVQLDSLTNLGTQNWYLLDNGIAQSGVQKWMGSFYYFDPITYLRVDNDYREQVWQDGTHDWYMFGNDGRIVTGVYNWQGSIYYFDPSSYLRVDNEYISTLNDGRGYLFGTDGRAVSGVHWWVGTYYYFDPVTHLRVDNDYREQVWQDGTHDWYMFGDGGRIVTGPYKWQGSLYYFDP